MSEEWHVRDDALRLYRETELTPEQVAERLGIDPETVIEWIKKNGRLRTIHMPQYRMKLRARRMEIMRLSANNHDDAYIAKVMGLSERTNIARIRAKAIEETAQYLRDQGAWERERVKHLARIEALLTSWMPKAIGSEEVEADPKFGDLALKALGQIAQVSGFNTINVHTSGDGNAPSTEPDADVQTVLTSLNTLAQRLAPPAAPVIEGELAGTDEEPVSELPSQNGLTTQHD